MNNKFEIGDRVVVVGHPDGLLSRDLEVTRTSANGAVYVDDMDNFIGDEVVINRIVEPGYGYKFHRYYLVYENGEKIGAYWIDEWLEHVDRKYDFDIDVGELL